MKKITSEDVAATIPTIEHLCVLCKTRQQTEQNATSSASAPPPPPPREESDSEEGGDEDMGGGDGDGEESGDSGAASGSRSNWEDSSLLQFPTQDKRREKESRVLHLPRKFENSISWIESNPNQRASKRG